MKVWLYLFILFPIVVSAQEQHKRLNIKRFDGSIKIDGHLDESIWNSPQTPTATDFVMLEPGNGEPIPKHFKTDVKIVYNDDAIYVGAFMRDDKPDSILTQLTERDDYFQNHDWFLIAFNPYNDGLSDFNFVVTAAGVQADSRTTNSGDDLNWNTVWHSAVQINDSGWVVEMKIPYMALRFPKNQSSTWGFNMIRNIRRHRTQWSYNYINRNSGFRYEYQCAYLEGFEEINPPVRLSLMPFISSYADNTAGSTSYDFNAGLDLKYGISESFTLDMTLIPDFGQVGLDEQFVNTSPFENQFDENRQFFTEGTELFNMGNIFYSRRIGGTPTNISNVELDETSTNVQTDYTRLLNASKISGRTEGNLGIGFLNAITDDSYTTYIDADGVEQSELFEPLTNYNMLVLDQRFNRNSTVVFINTNVWRKGSAYDANVAGLLTSINFNEGNYQFDASLKRSDKMYTNETKTGHEITGALRDVDGKWVWSVYEEIRTDQYDPNDLGFQQRANFWLHSFNLEYRILQPHGKLNRSTYSFFTTHQTLFKPRRFEDFYMGLNGFWLDRNFNAVGTGITVAPFNTYDYFEPRTEGYFLKIYEQFSTYAFISTDYRKTLALDARFTYAHRAVFNMDGYSLSVEPRIRMGDNFFSILSSRFEVINNNYGFANSDESSVFFGRRNNNTITNGIEGRYVFDNTKTLSLNARHYWNGINYKEMFELQTDGTLVKSDIDLQDDGNFNTVTMDLRFSWWFAPGSEMVILYRYVVAGGSNDYQNSYLFNLEDALNLPTQNNLSLRLTYFLDYNRVRDVF